MFKFKRFTSTLVLSSLSLSLLLFANTSFATENADNNNSSHYIVSDLDDHINPLKGTKNEEGTWKDNPIIAVMLDNHPDALPQAGLSQADLVYEERVEGSYTRLMAIFNSERPSLIGPIRSTRLNFLQRMFELEGIITRVGGSYEADNYIAENSVKQIDGSSVGSDVMWRYNDTGKFAPHNMYASYESLSNYAKSIYEQGLSESPFKFNEQVDYGDLGTVSANNISLSYGGDNNVEYTYDSEKDAYLRANNGIRTIDENNSEQVEIKNLIVQFADSEVYDDNGHQRVHQIGEGKAYLFNAGKVIELKWSKEHSYAKTVFTLASTGEELELKPGLTWINVIEEGTAGTSFFN